ncbi:MAG: AzlC family ABC transporter permease [Clostridia bacterium]|nr:AzlC family ABC transporter permease [Clostridia bacterium]
MDTDNQMRTKSVKKRRSPFVQGVRDGFPIALSYLSVSFGIGIAAVARGISAFFATLMSALNMTSAGEVAALSIIAAGGTFGEMALTQLVINARYFLMSLSLSQRMDGSFTSGHRLLSAMCVTDEIFGVAYTRKEPPTPAYLYGLFTLPFFGWVLGTLLGALIGSVLPPAVRNALGICIYGMFISIFLPPVRENKGVAFTVAVAVALSCTFAFLPVFSFLSSGFSVIICSSAGAGLAAWLFPVPDKEETV